MKKSGIPYNKNLKQLSRKLRNQSTLSEVSLWNELKGGKLRGYKFNRQKPLGNYIADFYCKNLNLVIEIDGITHVNNELKDIKRQARLENFNLKFLRFEDDAVKDNLDYVIKEIEKFIDDFEDKAKG